MLKNYGTCCVAQTARLKSCVTCASYCFLECLKYSWTRGITGADVWATRLVFFNSRMHVFRSTCPCPFFHRKRILRAQQQTRGKRGWRANSREFKGKRKSPSNKTAGGSAYTRHKVRREEGVSLHFWCLRTAVHDSGKFATISSVVYSGKELKSIE